MVTDVRRITSRLTDMGFELNPDAQGRLERNLFRSSTGDSRDLRTPFAGGRPREEIEERYRKEVGFTKYAELTAIDEKEISKWGSFSIMLPWTERRDSVTDFEHQTFSADMATLDKVVWEMSKLFPRSSFRPMDIHTAVLSMPRGKMLGLPTMSSDDSLIPQYEQRARINAPTYPAVAGWRGQAAGLHVPPKQRLVWMMDHKETIDGLRILYPVLNRLRVLPGFSAWSNDLAVDTAITKLLQTASGLGETVVSADYSGFDASVSYTLIQYVFDLLRYWFTDETKSLLDELETVFTTIPLVTPDGVFTNRKGGVPSGSALTNLVDTLVNVMAGRYAALKLGVTLQAFEVLGDDSVFVFHPFMGVDELSEVLSELGLESNPEKQFVSKRSAHFLQRWHSLDYLLSGEARGVRSLYRALNGIMSLERWVPTEQSKYKYLMAARAIMQINNVRWHPFFHKSVELVKEDEPVLRTGIDPTTVFRRAGGSEAIRSALSIASFPFNQQDPDMVEEFAATAVLREIA
jgi:hypothetical protein